MSTTKRSFSPAVIVILAIAALLAVAGSLIGTNQEIRQTETFDFNPDDHPADTAMVMSKAEREGFTLFWIVFRRAEYHVDVSFAVPGACWEQVVNDETWPIADSNCAGPGGLSGPISGFGRTADGDTMVSVAADVSADCYSAVDLGMTWPLPVQACRASG